MKQTLLAVLILIGATTRAAAQSSPTVALEAFLEQRVAEELAADGTILARLGVRLEIEQIGDKLLVSLVDPATGRAAASTKLDGVDENREAAVAAVTQVVANLAAQVGGLPASAEPVTPAPPDERDEREARERAESLFRREAIYFGDELAIATNLRTYLFVGTRVVAYQGEERRRLEGGDFYRAIARPDLADAYARRRRNGYIALYAGIGAAAAGTGLMAKAVIDDNRECFDGSYNPIDCDTSHVGTLKTAGGILMVGGVIGISIGAYFVRRAHPMTLRERYQLAAQHNAGLRRKYGLEASRRATRALRDLALAPYVGGDGGGVVLGGAF